MYILKKIALRKTKIHSNDTTIGRGEIYYQICNGTIGKGARHKNISVECMNKIMNDEASNWSKGRRVTRSDIPEPTKCETNQMMTYDLGFDLDDIPF